MRRDELRDALRRASRTLGEKDFVVLGSQSIHGAFNKAVLPESASLSMEVDLLPLHDDKGEKFWALSAIGALTGDVEIDGVDITTSSLPDGWVDRLIPFIVDDTPDTVIGWCLEPHDLAVAKVLAGRPKDYQFVKALVRASLIDPREVARRLDHLDPQTHGPSKDHLETARVWLSALSSPVHLFKAANPRPPKGRKRPKREDFVRPVDEFADLRQVRDAALSGKLVLGSATCRYCSGRLTNPRSAALGYGPVCAKKHGLSY